MRIDFQGVTLRRTRSGKCTRCGKRTTRTVNSHQTINPFNVTASGLPKTREQIYKELHADIVERCSRPLICAGCESKTIETELARLDRTGKG